MYKEEAKYQLSFRREKLHIKMSNKLIQALEPRLMLDGAAVATAIDAVDDLAQFQKPDNDKSSKADHFKVDTVSYTHLTLPTIYSV